MAVLSGFHVLRALGGYINCTSPTHPRHMRKPLCPYVGEGKALPGGAALAEHWPVEANGRALSGERLGAFVDFYYRIHISPRLLNLGNVASTQSTVGAASGMPS